VKLSKTRFVLGRRSELGMNRVSALGPVALETGAEGFQKSGNVAGTWGI
jgi:hypothetical protein